MCGNISQQTHFSHEVWIERHLESKHTLFCPHNPDIQGQLTHKHLKLKLEVELGRGLQGEPIFAHNVTNFRGKAKFFRVHIVLFPGAFVFQNFVWTTIRALTFLNIVHTSTEEGLFL